jgi:hypothetical protein
MSVESDLFSALQALTSGRVFPDVAPLTTAQPYITYQQVGGESVAFVENGIPSQKNARVQINIWGATRSSVSALALQVEAALMTATAFQARPLGSPMSTYDGDMLIFGAMQDFTVWSAR